MKKQIALIFSAICFLLTGCATSITKRGMLDDNTYYSTYSPNIQIKVDPSFSYKAGESGKFQHQFKNNFKNKYIYIHHFKESPNPGSVDYYYNPSSWIFWDVPPSEKIESGTVNILNKKWYYCHYFRQSSTGSCAILKDIAIFTSDHDILKIRYVKGLPQHDCDNWDRQDVEAFKADFSKDIEITNYEIGKDIEQSAKATDQPKEKQKLTFTPESALKRKMTGRSKEKPKLAAIPKDVSGGRVSLRKEPMEISNEMKIINMLVEYNFFDNARNPLGAFVNELVDNNDGTVTDKATGLMWQKSGSSSSLEKRAAKEYIKQMNRERFAGYSDWRMPTVEELASLLARSRIGGVHMAPVFDKRQTNCWVADKCDSGYVDLEGSWIVDFKQGQILQATYKKPGIFPSPGPDYSKNTTNYIKAVRSVK
jgi:hypothetical protein